MVLQAGVHLQVLVVESSALRVEVTTWKEEGGVVVSCSAVGSPAPHLSWARLEEEGPREVGERLTWHPVTYTQVGVVSVLGKAHHLTLNLWWPAQDLPH